MSAQIITLADHRPTRPESAGNPFLGVAWGAVLWLIMATVMVAWWAA